MSRRLLAVTQGSGGFQPQPFPPVASWTITRSGSNPCITIPAAETTEQYVPAPFRLADGTIWVYVKGASRIYGWKSTDNGVTFTIQNGGVAVLTPGGVGAWDHDFVLEPTVVYDQANATIHLWYKGALSGAWSWGHATASDSAPTTFTKDAGNPVLSGSAVNTQLGGAGVGDLAISSVLQIGSTYHFYGYVQYNSVYYLCQTTGTSWNNPTSSGFTTIARFGSDTVYQTPSVIRAPDNSYLMLYASGAAQPGARSIYTATAPDGVTWTSQTGTVLAPTGSGWEQDEAYSGQFIRSNIAPFSDAYIDGSGRWLYYYSGLDNGSPNVAKAGLAYITP